MADAIDACPLCWPVGRPRTARRERARFDVTFARARDEVVHQIELMTGRYDWMRREAGLVISTNIALRRDGLPLAGQRQPDDPGVAVYFTYRKRPMCFACDRWDRVEHNMQAIAKTICAQGHIQLARPALVGYRIDVLYRMLRWRELARATSFDDDGVEYQFYGNATEITKQIGNAVPNRTVKAHVRALMEAA